MHQVSIGNLLFSFLSWIMCFSFKKCNSHHFKTKTYPTTKTNYYSKAKTSYNSKTKTVYYPEANNYYDHNTQTNYNEKNYYNHDHYYNYDYTSDHSPSFYKFKQQQIYTKAKTKTKTYNCQDDP